MKRTLAATIKVVQIAVVFGCFIQCNNSETKDNTKKNQLSETADKVTETQPVLDNVKTLVTGNFTKPLWSPDGNRILFTKEGNIGLYYADVHAPGMIVELNDVKGAGYGAAWSQDGNVVFFNEKKNVTSTVKSISLLNKELVTAHPDIDFSAIRSYAQTNGKGPIIQLNPKTLKVEATDPQTGKSWIVSTDEGQFYEPLLSPDRTKVAVHRGAAILVYHTDGSGLYKLLGKGIVSSWSPDSKYLLAFLDESTDGQQVTNSELYLLAVDGSYRYLLTATPDVHEMWPAWNPVKNEIAFADVKTGQIMIAEIHF